MNKRSSVGMWVFLSVLLVVLAAGAITYVVIARNDSIRREDLSKAQEVEDAKAGEKRLNETMLTNCLADADASYWHYVKINSTNTTKDELGGETYYAPQHIWDTANSNKKNDQDNCHRTYQN